MNLKDMDFEQKIKLAANTTDPEVLEQLSTDGSASVRRYVAEHPSCPPHVLEKPLSKDKDDLVRAGVAANKNCLPHVLIELSKDGKSSVRLSVAGNPNCPEPVLINLCDDPIKYVRDVVGDNPRSFDSPQIAEKLKAVNKKTVEEYEGGEDEDGYYLSNQIPKNLNAPSHLHKSINTDLELLLALHKYLMRGN